MEKQKSILIVDDIEDVRESLALILEDEGYNTFHASNGLKAIKALAANHIDIMITDILMPEMDGLELATEARKKFPKLKMILISGGGRQTQNGGDYNYLDLTTKLTGINHVLKKPFKPLEIINLVHQLLEN